MFGISGLNSKFQIKTGCHVNLHSEKSISKKILVFSWRTISKPSGWKRYFVQLKVFFFSLFYFYWRCWWMNFLNVLKIFCFRSYILKLVVNFFKRKIVFNAWNMFERSYFSIFKIFKSKFNFHSMDWISKKREIKVCEFLIILFDKSTDFCFEVVHFQAKVKKKF